METYISPLFVRIDFHYFLKLQEQKQKNTSKIMSVRSRIWWAPHHETYKQRYLLPPQEVVDV